MIIWIEEKQYASKSLRFVRAIKSAGNKAVTKMDNALIKVNNKLVHDPLVPKSAKEIKITPKSKTQINRETVKLKDGTKKVKKTVKEKTKDGVNSVKEEVTKVKNNPKGYIKNKSVNVVVKTGHGIEKAKKSINTAIIDPGGAVDKAVKKTVENPITAVSQVAGKAAMATGNPALMAAPIGGVGTGLEQGLKKISPKYRKVTENLGKKYESAEKTRTKVRRGTEGFISGLRNMAMIL